MVSFWDAQGSRDQPGSHLRRCTGLGKWEGGKWIHMGIQPLGNLKCPGQLCLHLQKQSHVQLWEGGYDLSHSKVKVGLGHRTPTGRKFGTKGRSHSNKCGRASFMGRVEEDLGWQERKGQTLL